ncbi:hypothetical protein [Pseudodesulfovibrio pelocollis]|uniref:hypothetical protein n=1 Tax=Pseudodesulfovibrio pelocollis TaxID=3051432 RepID=UPI00255AC31A|nr:hypothetical protein [Pseudodesulfovibrio sp. SB368]
MEIQDRTPEEVGLELARELERAINRADGRLVMQGFAKGFNRMHPSLQQSAMRGFLHVFQEIANNRMVDGRNRATIEFAKTIVKLAEDTNVYLPLV